MKILIAEDDALSRRMLEARLTKWGYDVLLAEDGTQALDALLSPCAPRIAILDWIMPGMDGLEVTRRVREIPDRPFTYIILLTSKDQKQDIISALDSGADDYLIKPYDAEELRSRIGVGLRILNLQSQLEELNLRLAEQARTDHLTGLLNRRAILERLTTELNRCSRRATPLAVMMADIDYFKTINDTHGHAVGDAVLLEVAGRLSRAIRRYDLVGRVGGEEFLLVLPDISESDAEQSAERIRSTIHDTPFITEELQLDVALSIGVVWFQPGPSETLKADLVVRLADAQLYQAKESGRNRVAFSSLKLNCTDSPEEALTV